MNKFFVFTLGCRLNQAESQELGEILISQGWQETDKPGKADLIFVNTCVVTTKAERETRKEIRRLKRENPKAKLVAAGCWVNKIDQFGGKQVEVDKKIKSEEKWSAVNSLDGVTKSFLQGVTSGETSSRALIKIQSGCHNQCTYCLPTLVRGPSVSIPADEIINQVKDAVESGAVEVVLTGQNVSQYNDAGKTWIDLVEQVLTKTDIQLLRLGSINPTLIETSNFNYLVRSHQIVEELGGLYQGTGKNRLARHLHLSLQSGSDRILKRMNRNYTTDQFAEVVKNLRGGIEGINITTDVIVGFPGETSKDFQKTLDFCREMQFGKVHVFRYSPRKGTLAFEKRKEWGRINSKIKKKRSKKMRNLEHQLRRQFWQSQIGQTAIAKIWDSGTGLTDNYIPIEVDLDEKLTRPVVKKVKLKEFSKPKTSNKVDDPLRREASHRIKSDVL